MENRKSNKGLVIFLSALVVLFAIVSVLEFLGIFNINTFKDSKKTVKVEKKEKIKVKENKEETNKKETLYYQYLNEINHGDENLWNSRELILNPDGTAEYKYGGNASGGGNYKGTYLEDDNYIVVIANNAQFSNITECDPNNVADSCSIVLVFKKVDKELVSIEEYKDENNKIVQESYNFKMITKDDLKLFINTSIEY